MFALLPFAHSLDRTLRAVRRLAKKGEAVLDGAPAKTLSIADQLNLPHNRRVIDAIRANDPKGLPMNRTLTSIFFAALAALVISTSAHAGVLGEKPLLVQQRCSSYGDVVFCFRPPFVVDAFTSVEQ